MKNKGINISSVKVCSGGMKGLEVCYSKVEEGKDGRDWVNEYWTGRTFPISGELKELVKAFRFYLYDVYGYDMDYVNQAELEIEEIKSEMGSFIIKGKQKVLDGTKYVGMKTPKILEEDDYGKYEEVMGLVGQFYEKVGEYMEGKLDMVDNVQLVLDYNVGKEFDEASFMAMGDSDKRDMATKILEKMGSIVIHNDEVNGDFEEGMNEVTKGLDESVQDAINPVVFDGPLPEIKEVVKESPAQPNFGTATVPVVESPVFTETVAVKPMFGGEVKTEVPNFDVVAPLPEKVKKGKKVVEVDEEGELMSLNITPVTVRK